MTAPPLIHPLATQHRPLIPDHSRRRVAAPQLIHKLGLAPLIRIGKVLQSSDVKRPHVRDRLEERVRVGQVGWGDVGVLD